MGMFDGIKGRINKVVEDAKDKVNEISTDLTLSDLESNIEKLKERKSEYIDFYDYIVDGEKFKKDFIEKFDKLEASPEKEKLIKEFYSEIVKDYGKYPDFPWGGEDSSDLLEEFLTKNSPNFNIDKALGKIKSRNDSAHYKIFNYKKDSKTNKYVLEGVKEELLEAISKASKEEQYIIIKDFLSSIEQSETFESDYEEKLEDILSQAVIKEHLPKLEEEAKILQDNQLADIKNNKNNIISSFKSDITINGSFNNGRGWLHRVKGEIVTNINEAVSIEVKEHMSKMLLSNLMFSDVEKDTFPEFEEGINIELGDIDNIPLEDINILEEKPVITFDIKKEDTTPFLYNKKVKESLIYESLGFNVNFIGSRVKEKFQNLYIRKNKKTHDGISNNIYEVENIQSEEIIESIIEYKLLIKNDFTKKEILFLFNTIEDFESETIKNNIEQIIGNVKSISKKSTRNR
jgi:hypothetical protein